MEKVEIKDKKSLLPWIIPIVALIATAWLVYKSISERGVEVIVNFKDGSSLKEGKTFVKYKGFNVGQVTKISIADDLASINAHIKINQDVANIIAREGSVFWIVEPNVSVSEISGLDTLISGSYVEVRPASENREKIESLNESYKFEGYSQKPIEFYSENGINLVLETTTSNDVQRGTPVFYKKIITGKVVGTKLEQDKVKVYININKEYENLVNKSTLFYKSGGFKLDASLDGLNLKVDSAVSLLSGGISFMTPIKDDEKVKEKDSFHLYEDIDDIMIGKVVAKIELKSADGFSSKTPIVYKGIKIGKLGDIEYKNDKVYAPLIIDEKYKAFLTDNTKFYKVGSDLGNLDLSNLDTLVKGVYISFIPKNGKESLDFKLYDSYNSLEENGMTIVNLEASKFSNLNVGSEVYYKNIVVGRIIDNNFSKDLQKVKVKVAIESKYETLLNDKTLFYIISTPLVEMENFDLSVNFERFKPFLLGGVGIEYFESKKDKKDEYFLYDSYNDLKDVKKGYIKGLRLDAKVDKIDSITKNMSISYKNIDIGYVEEVYPLAKTPYIKVFIEDKYRYLVDSDSKFYIKSAVEFSASLSGIDFKMNTLGNLLKGSIELTNEIKENDEDLEKFKYKIYSDYEDLPFKRVEIVLNNDSAKGLKDGTKIFYKGIEVGKIYKATLLDDLKSVKLNAYIYEKYKALCVKDTIFYMVKPKISLDEVSGLDTVIKGSYIEVSKGSSSYSKNEFNLRDDIPNLSEISKGKKFKLYTTQSTNINEKTKVYYKKREIGIVENVSLSDDSIYTILDIFIYKKYQNLIRENSIFYNVSGIQLDVSLLGADVKMDSVKTLLDGGIGVSTPNDIAPKAFEGYNFELNDEYKEEWREFNPKIKLDD